MVRGRQRRSEGRGAQKSGSGGWRWGWGQKLLEVLWCRQGSPPLLLRRKQERFLTEKEIEKGGRCMWKTLTRSMADGAIRGTPIKVCLTTSASSVRNSRAVTCRNSVYFRPVNGSITTQGAAAPCGARRACRCAVGFLKDLRHSPRKAHCSSATACACSYFITACHNIP